MTDDSKVIIDDKRPKQPGRLILVVALLLAINQAVSYYTDSWALSLIVFVISAFALGWAFEAFWARRTIVKEKK